MLKLFYIFTGIFIFGNIAIYAMEENEEQLNGKSMGKWVKILCTLPQFDYLNYKIYSVDSNKLSLEEFSNSTLSELIKFSYEVPIRESESYIRQQIINKSLLRNRSNQIKLRAEKNNKTLMSFDEY